MKRTFVLLFAALSVAACSQSSAGSVAAPPPEPTPPPTPVLDPVGTFDYQTEVEGMPVGGSFTITGSTGAYTGTMTSDMGAITLRDIEVDGQELTAVGDSPDFIVVFVLEFDGDSFTGEWEAEGLIGYITGSRR